MSDDAPDLWQLRLRLAEADAYRAAERLGFLEESDALSVSVFEDGDRHAVEAIYGSQEDARTAQGHVGGDIARVEPQDWVTQTQSGLAPVTAGRFVIHGSHDAPGETGVIPILVDAGLAFGTGHHGTTQGCLIALDDLSATRGFGTVLDLGTGAGVLAIAAAKLFPEADILATDNDPDAVAVTETNMALNDVSFDAALSEGFEADALSDRTFDLIFANILAGPLRGLAPDIAKALRPDGVAILSGILDEQADWVAEAFAAQSLAVEAQPSIDGWTTLIARRQD